MSGDAAGRRLFLILYDIAAPRRRRKVFALLQAAGAWTQYSAFFCRLGPAAMAALEAKLRKTLDATTDRLLIADLGDADRAQARIRAVGAAAAPPAPAPFVIV